MTSILLWLIVIWLIAVTLRISWINRRKVERKDIINIVKDYLQKRDKAVHKSDVPEVPVIEHVFIQSPGENIDLIETKPKTSTDRIIVPKRSSESKKELNTCKQYLLKTGLAY